MSDEWAWPEDWPQGKMQLDTLEAWAYQEAEQQRKARPTLPQLQAHYDAKDAAWRALMDERNRLAAEWRDCERAVRGDDSIQFVKAQQRMALISSRAPALESEIGRAAGERQQAFNELSQARAELEEIKSSRRRLRPDVNGIVYHGLSRLQAMGEDLRLAKAQQQLEGK